MKPTIVVYGIPATEVFQMRISILKSRLRQILGGESKAEAHISCEMVESPAFGDVKEIRCSYIIYNLSEMPHPEQKTDFTTEVEAAIEMHCRKCQKGIRITFNCGTEDVRTISK